MGTILIINGPNMNKLGQRDQSLYGAQTLDQLIEELRQRAAQLGAELNAFQSNSEGEIVDFIQREAARADGIILNPAALTGSGYSVLDALLDAGVPFVEVHISNIHSREAFRRKSIFAASAAGQISGLGTRGYHYALEHLAGKA